MKTLALFSISLFVSLTSFAATEILEATELGPTHIDPVSMSTFINYKTDYQYNSPKVTFANCKMDSSGNPEKNYFIIKKQDDKGVVQNMYLVRPGSSCQALRAADTAIANCEEHSAVEFTVSDPDECAQGKCQKLSTPRIASTPLSINLGGNNPNPSENIKKLQAEIEKCSKDKKYILVRDGSKSLVASLADMSHCKLDKKRVITDGAKWDDNESPLTRIFTSNRAGFYIGEHTHYYFDETKNDWCIHFRPDLGSTEPSCGYKNMTRSIAFAVPGEQKITQKGVVKLTVDDKGNPIAVIGHPKTDEYNKSPELDESKPVLKVSLTNKPGEPRKTVFESKASMNGATTRTLNVSPTYSVGTKIAQANSCDSNACLNAAKEILDPNAQVQCKNNETKDFTLPGSGKETCFSCNGVSSGACGKDKVVLNKNNISEYTNKINACRAQDAEPATPEGTVEPEVAQ